MARKTKPNAEALETLRRRYYEGKPARLRGPEETRGNEELAGKILEMRAAAELTQIQLGRLVGTTASVICRLENAEYEGHSLQMLRRIGAALHHRVEIKFVPIGRLLD